jgi:hypothetical protein
MFMERKFTFLKTMQFVCLLVLTIGIKAQEPGKHLLVFDQLYPDYQLLANDKQSSDDVLILPLAGNPLDHIYAALANANYNEVHIYALSKPNAIVFNARSITENDIDEIGTLLSKWKEKLLTSSTIVIHSEVLEGDIAGDKIIAAFRMFTNSNVVVKP